MKKTLRALSAFAIIGLSCSCGSSSSALSILHVNDTHSHVEAIRGGDRAGHGGIIERAAIVDSVRNARGADNVLLVHAGDFNQGTSYFNTYGGYLEVSMINALGYDCITLGNHEFDNGIEDLASRLEKIECPVVCANVDFNGTALEGLVEPYTVIKKTGLKIGIVGATSNLAHNVSYAISSRLHQYDNVESITKAVEALHFDERCDLIIFLSHLGYHEDQKIVPHLRYVDMVIGGHSHTFVDDFVYVRDADGYEVPIITDGCWGYDVGEITIAQ